VTDVHHDDDSLHSVRRAKHHPAPEGVHRHGPPIRTTRRPAIRRPINRCRWRHSGSSAANGQPGPNRRSGMVQKFRQHGILIVGAAGVYSLR
jgi:hypothetical protein